MRRKLELIFDIFVSNYNFDIEIYYSIYFYVNISKIKLFYILLTFKKKSILQRVSSEDIGHSFDF
jgi:hypothetical protein